MWSQLAMAGANAFSTYQANAQSKKLMAKQFHYQKKMWEMENEYNKPVNQMARLQEAGLNPNLVYGNGATSLGGSMGSVSQPTAKELDLSPLDELSQYQSIVNMEEQQKNINTGTEQLKNSIKNSNLQTSADLAVKEQQALNLQSQRAQTQVNTLYSIEQMYAQKMANLGAMMDLYQDAQLGGPRISKTILDNMKRQYEYDNMPLTKHISANGSGYGFAGSINVGGQFRQ